MIRRAAFFLSVLALASPALRAESSDDAVFPAIVPLPAARAEDPIAHHEMQVHFLIATEYYKDGRYQAAIDEWRQVLKIQPNHTLAREKIQKAKEKLAAEPKGR